MGYQAAKLLHRLLNNEALPLQRQLIPPMRVVELPWATEERATRER
jgi:LacI family transcriptional regulator